MNWELRQKKAKPARPGKRVGVAGDTIKVGACPPVPDRDLYTAVVGGRTWPEVEKELVDFWVKLCEVLPKYHQGPKSARPWNRVVCVVDGINGTVATQLWKDGRMAKALPHGNVTLVVRLSLAVETGRKLSAELGDAETPSAEKKWSVGVKAVRESMIAALARSADREPAKSKLDAARKWHPFALFAIDTDKPELVRPLLPDGAPARKASGRSGKSVKSVKSVK